MKIIKKYLCYTCVWAFRLWRELHRLHIDNFYAWFSISIITKSMNENLKTDLPTNVLLDWQTSFFFSFFLFRFFLNTDQKLI